MVKTASSSAPKRACQPSSTMSPPPSSNAIAPTSRNSGNGSPAFAIVAAVAVNPVILLNPDIRNSGVIRTRPASGP
jgi:hypothetical protein